MLEHIESVLAAGNEVKKLQVLMPVELRKLLTGGGANGLSAQDKGLLTRQIGQQVAVFFQDNQH